MLWDGCEPESDKFEFSCVAINMAAGLGSIDAFNVQNFVAELGVPTYSVSAFSEFRGLKDRQAARYSWLKFAAMVAEEEGL